MISGEAAGVPFVALAPRDEAARHGARLAEEPGLDPAPQTAAAAAVDDAVGRWLGAHLSET